MFRVSSCSSSVSSCRVLVSTVARRARLLRELARPSALARLSALAMLSALARLSALATHTGRTGTGSKMQHGRKAGCGTAQHGIAQHGAAWHSTQYSTKHSTHHTEDQPLTRALPSGAATYGCRSPALAALPSGLTSRLQPPGGRAAGCFLRLPRCTVVPVCGGRGGRELGGVGQAGAR